MHPVEAMDIFVEGLIDGFGFCLFFTILGFGSIYLYRRIRGEV